jgi:hypothetical protein
MCSGFEESLLGINPNRSENNPLPWSRAHECREPKRSRNQGGRARALHITYLSREIFVNDLHFKRFQKNFSELYWLILSRSLDLSF